MPATVTHIEGRMYGDGEYVVEFHVSDFAPLSATILGSPDSTLRSVSFEAHVKPSIDVARRVVALARAQDGRRS